MPSSGLRCLTLDAKARLEQTIVRWRERLGALPGHRTVAVRLTRRRGDDQGRILELPAVKGQHVLDNKLRRIAMLAVHVVLDVEADHVIALCQQSLCPAAESAK